MMTFNDFLELSGALLVSVGGGAAVVFGLSRWLGKLWAEQILAKQIHDLQILRDQHQVRFSKLHEKQAESMRLLYDLLCGVEEQFHTIGTTIGAGRLLEPTKELLELQYEKASLLTSQFEAHYKLNRIYFSEKLCSTIEDLIKRFKSLSWRVMIETSGSDLIDRAAMSQLYDKISPQQKLIDSGLHQIHQEFRALLGVLQGS